MTKIGAALAAAALLSACAHSNGNAPAGSAGSSPGAAAAADWTARYPYLGRARDLLIAARKHLAAAEAAHADHGTLGGHGAQADNDAADALRQIEDAAAFATAHDRGGSPGEVKQRPAPGNDAADGRFPNLADARGEVARAIQALEDAEQFHGPIGGMGGHAKSAVDKCHEALRQIGEAEMFADQHKS